MSNPAIAAPGRGGLTPLWVLLVAIVLVTAGALRHVYDERFAHQAAQLEAVADLRTKQVESWLQERLSQARYASSSGYFAGLYRRWRDSGDIAARDQLIERVAELSKTLSGHDVLVVDERGEGIAGAMGSDRSTPPALRAAVLRAMASAEVQHTGLYSIASDPDKERLDVVAPLMATGPAMRAAVVLRLDLNDFLLPTLRVWPVPSRTASTLLVRREGTQLVGAFRRNPLPMSTPNLLTARALRGEVPFGQAAQALDFRGNPVLGVVRPVPGTDWFLVAKIDRAEILAEALENAAWIVAACVLALLGSAVGAFLLRERRALEMARAEQLRDAQRTEQLHRLGAELEAAENRERRQIARDLHDDLGQTLAAARIRLAALCNDEREDVRRTASEVDALIDSADLSTRSLAARLVPAVLYELGLCPALEWLGEEIERTFGLKVIVVDDGSPKPLSQEARSILYRAARELLINVAKHARTDAAIVETLREGERIVVRVSDAGVGFDPAPLSAAPQRGQGLGLVSVRERLSFIGGTAEVRSVPGDGTIAVLSAPLATDEALAAEGHP